MGSGQGAKFSSPYGDKLHNHWTHGTMPTSTSFRPLTGIVHTSINFSIWNTRFRPLTGINWNLLCLLLRLLTSCFRPLAGMVPDDGKPHRHAKVFVPLRSIVLLYHTLIQKKRTIHRRSADGVEMISHKDHLDSAEGASKP